MAKTVGVFFGGRSNEREISVITGVYALNLLRSAGYSVIPVFLPVEGGLCTGKVEKVADLRPSAKTKWKRVFLRGNALVTARGRKIATLGCALNCCHGGMGEDGTLAALLRWNGVKSASPGIAPSAIFMDKELTKIFVRGLGLPTLPAFALPEGEEGEEKVRAFGYPVIIKPLRLGSSIGVSVVRREEDLLPALESAFRLDGRVLVEQYLPGKRDLNCAACLLKGEIAVSPVEEVPSREDLLTFSEKYEQAHENSVLPARIPEETAERIQAYTKTLYAASGCKGVVRADFLLSPSGDVFFNELNTVPGSLSGYLFANGLIETRDFFCSLIEEGMKEEEQKEIVTAGILEMPLFSGTKGCKRR